MNEKRPFGAMAGLCMGLMYAGVLCLAPLSWAQAAPKHVGVPQGWSDRSVVFSLDGLAKYPNLMDQEPRIRQQVMQRFRALNPEFFQSAERGGVAANNPAGHRDWNVNFVRGRVGANMYPAKYSFDPGAPPDCTNDYVVFGLNIAGTTNKQANLIAFNNLYSGVGGICGLAPTVLFAYNVTTQSGGKGQSFARNFSGRNQDCVCGIGCGTGDFPRIDLDRRTRQHCRRRRADDDVSYFLNNFNEHHFRAVG